MTRLYTPDQPDGSPGLLECLAGAAGDVMEAKAAEGGLALPPLPGITDLVAEISPALAELVDAQASFIALGRAGGQASFVPALPAVQQLRRAHDTFFAAYFAAVEREASDRDAAAGAVIARRATLHGPGYVDTFEPAIGVGIRANSSQIVVQP